MDIQTDKRYERGRSAERLREGDKHECRETERERQ